MNLSQKRSIKVIIITIFLVMVLVGIKVLADSQIEPTKYTFIKDTSEYEPTAIEISPKDRNSYLVKDKRIITDIHNYLKNLDTGRIVNSNIITDDFALSIGYNSDSGQMFYIDRAGDIYTFHHKIEIAQESRLRYICWKINQLYDRDHLVWYKVSAGTDFKRILPSVSSIAS